MEVSTKERLTGALIVVLALIIIAPEMLSGRRVPEPGTPPAQDPEDGAPLQAYSFRLDSSNGGTNDAREAAPAVAAEITAVPPPVAEETSPAPRAPAVSTSPVDKAESRPAAGQGSKTAASATPPATAAAGKWWVQVGSFASRDNAQRKAQTLRDRGYSTEVSRTRQNGTELYRVRAGPVADREAAAALQARLVAAGEKNPTLVAP